jgi:hypothetical protein
MCVLHRCDHPPCVNVLRHLFLGTQRDNIADRVAKGRSARGTAVEQAKLTAADVLAIRTASTDERGEQTRFAREYGVAQSTISLLLRRKTW